MPESRYTSSAANRRLEQLRRQVYGSSNKSADQSIKVQNSDSSTSPSDTVFLGQDLTKIALLSSLALSVEVLLYIALKNNLVKLPI